MPGHRTRSDYERGLPGNTNVGPNDATMAPKDNAVSRGLNSVIDWALEGLGYDGDRRAESEENDFYRDNAQYMPGYEIDGIPSGAWAQDRATNYVGHPDHCNSPEEVEAWDYVRRSLVEKEGAMIDASLESGGDGKLSFWDVYNAHVEAYDEAPGGANSFIDPGSFALAVYAAPALEAVGIDAGPITGASIDIFNDPSDSATEGWAKRMGLAAGEIGAGALMMSNPITFLPGLGMTALGVGGAIWNTATAIGNGMLGEWGDAIADGAGAVWDGITDVGGAIADGASDLWDGAMDVGGDIVDGVGSFFSGW